MPSLQRARAALADGATLTAAARAGGYEYAAMLDRALWQSIGGYVPVPAPPSPRPRAARLVRAWTGAEIRRLQADYGRYPVSAIAKAFGRTPGSVRQKALMIGLTRPKRGQAA